MSGESINLKYEETKETILLILEHAGEDFITFQLEQSNPLNIEIGNRLVKDADLKGRVAITYI